MSQLQPFEMDISTAKPYQLEDAEILANWGKGVCRHKFGLGKTFIIIRAWNLLVNRGKPIKRVLILGSKSSQGSWLKQLPRWVDINPVQIKIPKGSKAVREASTQAYNDLLKAPVGVWLITFDTLRILMKNLPAGAIKVDMLIIDELHKIRNYKTLAFRAATKLRYDYFYAATATWASRGSQDLWTGFNLMFPKLYTSYWSWVGTFCQVQNGIFGKQIVGVRNATRLNDLLNSCSLTRRYEDVLTSMTTGTRYKVEVDMEEEQAKLYDQMHDQMVIEAGDGIIISSNVLARQTNLRLLSICPRMLHSNYPLGGMIEHLLDQIEEEPHTVVFCPFKLLFPILAEALRLRGLHNVYTLQGGTEPEEVDRRVAEWKSTKGVMLCTIQFAQSFDLDVTNTAWFAGFSYVPDDNFQAEGRLTRMNTKREGPLLIGYLLTRGTLDYEVQGIVDGKIINISKFLHEYIEKRIPIK